MRIALFLMVMICITTVATNYGGAMGPQGEENLPPAPAEKEAEDRLSIAKIVADPSGYEGKEIVLEGTFRGWKGTCETSMPLTRSDWILEDGTGCIYVTGRIPPGVSPMDPKGERLVVSGTVKKGEDKVPYLKAKRINIMPVPFPRQ